MLDNIRECHCQYGSINQTACSDGNNLNGIYDCYKNECFEERNANLLCINSQCNQRIAECLLDKDCGRYYLRFLEQKEICYDDAFVASGDNRCTCKQEGDADNYYEQTNYNLNPTCISKCDQCEQDSFEYLSQLCTNDNCPDQFIDILACIKNNCTDQYNEYIKPKANVTNFIDEIESCSYDSLCESVLLQCWSDSDCFSDFFLQYDVIMDIWLNSIYTLSNDLLFTITNANISVRMINKYFCNYIGYNTTCNDIFFELIECILNECIFENVDNCFWSSCSSELLGCIGPYASSHAGRCNQALLWLSYTYLPANGINDEVILEYIDEVDEALDIECKQNDDNLQCWYFNVVGYCMINKCIHEFWKIVDCVFENNCRGNGGTDLKYRSSGTSTTKYPICKRQSSSRDLRYMDITNGGSGWIQPFAPVIPPLNGCRRDWFKLEYCKWQYLPAPSLFLGNATSVKSVNEYLNAYNFTDCPFNRSIGSHNLTMAIYVDCLYVDHISYSGLAYIDGFRIMTDFIAHDYGTWEHVYNRIPKLKYKDTTFPQQGLGTWIVDDNHQPSFDILEPSCEIINTTEPTMFPTNEPTEFTQDTLTPTTSTTSDIETGKTNNGDEDNSDLTLIIIIASVIIVILLIIAGVIYYCKSMKKSENVNETQMTNY